MQINAPSESRSPRLSVPEHALQCTGESATALAGLDSHINVEPTPKPMPADGAPGNKWLVFWQLPSRMPALPAWNPTSKQSPLPNPCQTPKPGSACVQPFGAGHMLLCGYRQGVSRAFSQVQVALTTQTSIREHAVRSQRPCRAGSCSGRCGHFARSAGGSRRHRGPGQCQASSSCAARVLIMAWMCSQWPRRAGSLLKAPSCKTCWRARASLGACQAKLKAHTYASSLSVKHWLCLQQPAKQRRCLHRAT